MLRRRSAALIAALAGACATTVCAAASSTTATAAPPLLSPAPDHRAITPAGTVYATAGQFPAGSVLAPDGASLLIADANMTLDQVEAFNAIAPAISATVVPTSAPGDQAPDSQSGHLSAGPGNTVYGAGGSTGTVRVFTATSPPVQTATYQVGALNPLPNGGDHSGYIGDVVGLADGVHVVASEPYDAGGGKGTKVVLYDTSTQAVTASATVGHHPLALAITPATAGPQRVAVANTDDGTVSVLDAATLTPIATVAVGHGPRALPTALAFTADGTRLLVADANEDELVAIRTSDWTVVARVPVSGPDGIGAEPNWIALSPDGLTAFATLAGDNALAVVTRSVGADDWHVAGRIPTARYPTSVTIDAAHDQLFVTAGKAGAQTSAGMPQNLGAVEQIPLASTLASLPATSAQVGADDAVAPAACDASAVAGIQHVVYVIRENKTYDAEFGDLPGGLPAYLMYGQATTPNAHALANRFALMENFTSTEEVSDTGHQATMGSLANDWVQRMAEQAYNLGGAPRPGAELGNDDSVLWSPNDYLLDRALAAGISFRDYGEFYRRDQSTDAAVSQALDAHIVHGFPGFGFDPSTPDTQRIAYWRQTFASDVANASFPALEVIYLPEDHTTSTGGAPPAQTEVADADLALGQLVQSLSNSPYWSSTALFMTEDDPQDGMDHIDPHRTIGLVVGPHVRAGTQTLTPYDQLGMLRTIEQILGLAPLTEHDATARPLDGLFDPGTPTAATAPYTAITPNPPSMTAATRARLQTLSLRWFGHRSTASLLDRRASQKFALLWLATHNRPFRRSRALPGPGPAAVQPHARAAFNVQAHRAAAASPDCPALPAGTGAGGGARVGGATVPGAVGAGPGSSVAGQPAGLPKPASRRRSHRRAHLAFVLHGRHRALLISGHGPPRARLWIRLSSRGRHTRVLARPIPTSGRFRILVHVAPGLYSVRVTSPGRPALSRAARVA